MFEWIILYAVTGIAANILSVVFMVIYITNNPEALDRYKKIKHEEIIASRTMQTIIPFLGAYNNIHIFIKGLK